MAAKAEITAKPDKDEKVAGAATADVPVVAATSIAVSSSGATGAAAASAGTGTGSESGSGSGSGSGEVVETAAQAAARNKERLLQAQVERDKAIQTFLQDEVGMERKAQIDRISIALKLNPLDIMDLPLDAGASDVQKKFKELSLLIHPDKCSVEIREAAQKSFALLSQARNELLDVAGREALHKLVQEARDNIRKRRETEIKSKNKKDVKTQERLDRATGLGASSVLLPAPMRDVTKDDGFESEVKAELRELLIAREWRKRQLLQQAARSDGLAAAEKEEIVKAREEAVKAEEEWEKNRDGRVTNWRSFQKFGKKRNIRMPKLNETDDDKTYIKRVKLRGPAPQVQVDPNAKDD